MSQHLPTSGNIARDQWLKAATDAGVGGEAKQFLTKVEGLKFGPEKDAQGLFSWDPNATTDPLRLRAEATSRAEQASAGLNSLTPQYAAVRKQAVSKAINGALEKYLDQVAETSQDAAAAVRRIRADDVKWNVLLTAKSALKQKLDKQQIDMLNQAPGNINKFHGPTTWGVGLYAANAALRGGIRHAPRLEQSLANLPQSSPLSTALAGRAIPAAARFAAGQATAPPPAPPPATGTTQLGTAQ
jgi:hypothetical protein